VCLGSLFDKFVCQEQRSESSQGEASFGYLGGERERKEEKNWRCVNIVAWWLTNGQRLVGHVLWFSGP